MLAQQQQQQQQLQQQQQQQQYEKQKQQYLQHQAADCNNEVGARPIPSSTTPTSVAESVRKVHR
jgi:hypothetical protein